MSKLLTLLSAAFIVSSSYCAGESFDDVVHQPEYEEEILYWTSEDKTDELPVIVIDEFIGEDGFSDATWTFLPDTAQSKYGDWSTCIGVAHHVTIEQAMQYAESNPNVTFFFYVKFPMILQNDKLHFFRVFDGGDAVFFSGDPEVAADWGTAYDLADGYVKR